MAPSSFIGLALDLEADGANPATAQIVEIGFAVWDFSRRGGVPLYIYNGLVTAEGAPPMSPENIAIHGITNEDRDRGGQPMGVHLDALRTAIEIYEPTRLITHNGRAYDTPLLARHTPGVHPVFSLAQCDTKRDVPGITGRLAHLLADHARVINPFAHRALFDALSCCVHLQHLHDSGRWPFDKLCARIDAPKITFQSTQPFARNDEAKALGFAWNGDLKEWRQSIPESEVAELEQKAAAANIRIRRA